MYKSKRRFPRRAQPSFSFALSAAIGLMLLLVDLRPAFAHGSEHTLQVAGAAIGPYTLTVWTSPAVLRTGEVRVEAMVTDAHGVPMPDCLIYVAVSPLAQQAAPDVVVARPSTATQPAVEEAAFYVAQPGLYRVAVTVADRTGSVGRTDFTIEVMHAPVAVQSLIYLLILLSLLIAGWMLREGGNVWFGDQRRTGNCVDSMTIGSVTVRNAKGGT